MNTYNNYNTDYELYTNNVKKIKIKDVIEQLRYDLKILLKGKRLVNDINAFAVFFKAYQMQVKTGQPVWVSTKKLQHSFGLCNRDYQKYFEFCVAEWDNFEAKMANKATGQKGQCRTIKSFSPAFVALCEKYAGLQFDYEFYQKYYHSTAQFSSHQLVQLRKIIAQQKKREERETDTISSALKCEVNSQKPAERETDTISSALNLVELEDILEQDFYHSTEESPFRKYHHLQTLTKTVKSQMFNGYYDIDLQQCFASIAWHLLDMKNCTLSQAWLLNPEFKKDLRHKIQKDLNLETLDEAKQQVCALFTESYAMGDKLDWYKTLHFEIIKRTKAHFGQKVEWQGRQECIDTMHKFFTYHEQMIIAKLSHECEVVLNMHDGIIATKQPQANHVEYLGFEFMLSVNQFVDIQFIKTPAATVQQHTLYNMNMGPVAPLVLNKDYKEEILKQEIEFNIKNSSGDTQEHPDLIWSHLL